MATMTAATVAQAQQPLPAPVPLSTPPREPPLRTKTFSAYLASFSTPSTSSLSDYSYPSSVEAEEEEEEGETFTAIATATNPTHSSEYPLASAAPIAPPTPSITIQPASTTPSNPTASNPTVSEPQAEQGYPPLNVLDRIRILEEAREEQMRILRATGAVPDGAGAVRRYSVGGAREQISGLGEPWW